MPSFSVRIRGQMTYERRAALTRAGASLFFSTESPAGATTTVGVEAPDEGSALEKLRLELEPVGGCEVTSIRRAD
jgi:hypothetical protein